MIFPLLAETQWEVIGLTCDDQGIPEDPEKKLLLRGRLFKKQIFTEWQENGCILILV